MFDTLLVANRGEIACRVIATARRLGLRTIAVYSEADAQAKHVQMADEAVLIGPAPVADSYLKIQTIIEAAIATGAQAIHPGYGFLSENPDFVDAITTAGLTFVGPPADAIRAMGLKDAAKARMINAGVPVVPGYHGENQDPQFLAAEAERIGYPVMIKARAGGGGKGMRVVANPGEFAGALASAQRESQAAFGDPACLIEKFITAPRHIEIQVFADTHGNCVHMFERDCSLQRRHQKVIEEAPAPGMSPEVRAAMGQAATDAARSIGYQGAGTVEFIVDGSKGLSSDGFWFMEMNTRLQVEHPVSEAITGLDFVELQLRIATGQPLGLSQSDLVIDGHAFEARIYAEDAQAGFLPATGVLEHLSFPASSSFTRAPTRADSGVRAGDSISPYYDPMIAKLIVHGSDRAAALGQLQRALADTQIGGTVTNLEFLHALARDPDFAAGQMDTGLIAAKLAELTSVTPPTPAQTGLAAMSALGLLDPPATDDPWHSLQGFAAWGGRSARQVLIGPDGPIEVVISFDRSDQINLTIDGQQHLLSSVQLSGERVGYLDNGSRKSCALLRGTRSVTLFDNGRTHVWTLADPLERADDIADSNDTIVAPMPGLIKIVHAQAGATVQKGDPILVLEAMKMEHVLTAPRSGTLAELTIHAGDQVTSGTVLAMLVAEE